MWGMVIVHLFLIFFDITILIRINKHFLKPLENLIEYRLVEFESNMKRTIAKMGIPRPPFFSIIETKKTYDKGNLSRWKPEFKQYY